MLREVERVKNEIFSRDYFLKCKTVPDGNWEYEEFHHKADSKEGFDKRGIAGVSGLSGDGGKVEKERRTYGGGKV